MKLFPPLQVYSATVASPGQSEVLASRKGYRTVRDEVTWRPIRHALVLLD